MRKILKTLAVISPAIFLSNQVVSCVDERIDINELIEVTELGFVENLSSEEIIKSLVNNNPKAEGMEEAFQFSGNIKSYEAKVGLHPAYLNRYKGFVEISFNSKLAYKTKGESNEIDCIVSKTNKTCELDISILDSTYDPEKDKAIEISESLYDNFDLSQNINEKGDAYNIKAILKEDYEVKPEYNYYFRIKWHIATLIRCNIVFDLD
ncbi:hypothetical protein [Spiroplasma alleghenense]|uniref:Uncharacterized protein n=1 Tax=Spiroplasma alleghenense TaxID=216931 RepID=A0A345Z4W9_9MOLU|nr:hypothetical protein [Spiroplasma alleghenense]AXK51648.1 hypothetical protein SALLE_v1c09780 [Spiroplasma alleghenense]